MVKEVIRCFEEEEDSNWMVDGVTGCRSTLVNHTFGSGK